MNIIKRPSAAGDKITFYFDFGRGKGQRPCTGIWIYASPNDQIQKNHNKEALALLDIKKSQMVIESQSIGSPFIPSHKFKQNFIDYFQQYVNQNKRKANRHLGNSLKQFKKFVGNDFISPLDITENLCESFRQYLLDKYTGETPSGYYTRFKWVVRAATSDGYFQKNPMEMVSAKSNPSVRMKDNLESEDYLTLIETPCTNEEVKFAFLFSCYTVLRWVDMKRLKWTDITDGIHTARIIRAKTGRPITITLHPVATSILEHQKSKQHTGDCIFQLPTADGANKVLENWIKKSNIEKNITWSCARLSFAILLQYQNVDDATVAYLMGHTSTDQVRKTYKRHRPKDQMETFLRLPSPTQRPNFLLKSN